MTAEGVLFRPVKNNTSGTVEGAMPTDGIYKMVKHYAGSVEEFISGAATETRQEIPSLGTKSERWAGERYPWQAPSVRADITKVYNLHLPEPALLKLKYIAELTQEHGEPP